MDATDLYRALSAPVLGYLRAQGVPEPEDVLGDVFMQVARDWPMFPEPDDEAAARRWVFTVARHRSIDAHRRRRRRLRVVADEHELPDPVDEAAAAFDDTLPDPALVAALGALTDEQREVVALRFVADLSLDDVAALTGRTVGAVKAMQHRALENLRRAVSPGAAPTLYTT